MTLILKLDLDMVKMYLHTKNEVVQKMDTKIDRQTDIQTDTTENTTYPHKRVVKMFQYFQTMYHLKTKNNQIVPDYIRRRHQEQCTHPKKSTSR